MPATSCALIPSESRSHRGALASDTCQAGSARHPCSSRAWAALGVIANEQEMREHMAKLRKWERWLRKMKAAKLDRQVFETSRELEFFSEKELMMQVGYDKAVWPLALMKELSTTLWMLAKWRA